MYREVVFVYGTLKSGFPNNDLLKEQRYLGTAKTLPEYSLLSIDGNFPAMVDVQNKNGSYASEQILCSTMCQLSIQGEIWEVDRDSLSNLDILEGVNTDLYFRGKVELSSVFLAFLPIFDSSMEKIEKKQVSSYFWHPKQCHDYPVIASGDWLLASSAERNFLYFSEFEEDKNGSCLRKYGKV